MRIAVVLLALLAGPLAAQPVLRLALPEIPGLINVDGLGTYQRVMDEAARRAGVRFTAEVLPRARALAALLNHAVDGVFTFTQTVRERLGADAVLASYPIGAYRGYAFVLASSPPITRLSQLSGKRVGGLIGFEGTYGSVREAGASFELVNTDEQNLSKLKAGRLDAVLAFLPDLFSQLPELAFDPKMPFFEAYDRLTVLKTPANEAWLAAFSAELRRMHQQGVVRTLVGPAYLPVVGDFPPDR